METKPFLIILNYRLKDGRGESFYPRSSFSINCTGNACLFFFYVYFLYKFSNQCLEAKCFVQCIGDACKGDVVLFRQNVYKKRANIVGKRTVVGRIVKESYGASKQQHTFTVRVTIIIYEVLA